MDKTMKRSRVLFWGIIILSLILLLYYYLFSIPYVLGNLECNFVTPLTGDVNIRKTPDLNFDPIGVLKNGNRVQVIEREGLWYKLLNGGFVKSTVVVCDDPVTPTRLVTNTPIPEVTATRTIFNICINDVCGLWSEPIIVTIRKFERGNKR